MNIHALNVRLILWSTALATVVAAGFSVYTYYSLSHRLYEDLGQTLARRAAHIRDDILPSITQGGQKQLASTIVDLYSPEKSDRFIRISDPTGVPLYLSGMPVDGAFNPLDIPRVADYSNQVSVRVVKPATGEPLLLAGVTAKVGNNAYLVEMGAPTFQIDATLGTLMVTLLLGLPLVVIVAAFGGSRLVRKALQPVDAIRQTAESITFSNPRQRLPVNATGDALEQLSLTLNRMLERLESAYLQASRFSADASHEFRTPLTVMRSELESLVRAEPVPPLYRERAASVLEEAERLSGIVEGLLSIAQLEAGSTVERKAFDLAALASSTLGQMQLLLEGKELAAQLDMPHQVFVSGDVGRLKQVIVNILDNAVKYTPSGGLITFTVSSDQHHAVLRVADTGIGIPKTALPFVFDRFFRADNARGAQEPLEGMGLGLSIVEAVIQAHGGSVRAESVENEGTTITVNIPLATAQPDAQESALAPQPRIG